MTPASHFIRTALCDWAGLGFVAVLGFLVLAV